MDITNTAFSHYGEGPYWTGMLHYCGTGIITFLFVGAYSISIYKASLIAPIIQHNPRIRRYICIISSFLITAAYLLQSILFLIAGLRHVSADHPYTSTKNENVYVLLQTLLWCSLSLFLFNSSPTIRWSPFITAWTATAIVDILSTSSLQYSSAAGIYSGVPFAPIHSGLRLARAPLLVGLTAVGLSVLLLLPRLKRVPSEPAEATTTTRKDIDDPEREPLLPAAGRDRPSSSSPQLLNQERDDDDEPNNPSESSSSLSSLGHGSKIGKDDDDDDDVASVSSSSSSSSSTADSEDETFGDRELQYVRDDGGWIAHLRQYSIFFPYVWPRDNLRLKTYVWVLLATMLADRVVNVLYSQQLGTLVDNLYRATTTEGQTGKGGGGVPWADIFLFMAYQWLVSYSCGLPGLADVLESRLSNWSQKELSVAALDHLMGLPMSFHDGKDSGEVIKAVEQAGSLASILKALLMESVPFLMDILVACWYVASMLDAYGTIIVVFIALSFSFTTYYISIVMRRARREVAKEGRAQSRKVYEMVSNWATVSYFSRARHERARVAEIVGRATDATQWDTDISNLLFFGQEVCEIVGRLMLTALAAFYVVHGFLPVGRFVGLYSYFEVITTPLWQLGHSYRRVSADLVDAERLLQLLRTKSDIQDAPGAEAIKLSEGKVEFTNVSFGYDTRCILDDISFTVEPGKTVALVGETGSGKSTILKLLMRFYDVTFGGITIDGQDIRNVTLESLRESFGFVPQASALFNASILENVRYGRLDATDAEVQDACRAASLHDKIMTFPDGYHTTVGERGVKLSGGELQRIAIARVILKNPRIVLLDEATSALDTETEGRIQNALHNLSVGRTTIVIAHRLSTIAGADQILVVDKGKIIESGTHTELLAAGGKYSKLYR